MVGEGAAVAACQVPGVRYVITMTGERQELERPRIVDTELPDACAVCGGTISARFSPQGVKGVCLTCHLVTTLAVAEVDGGMRIGHLAIGQA